MHIRKYYIVVKINKLDDQGSWFPRNDGKQLPYSDDVSSL
jgi:hypothetical protein